MIQISTNFFYSEVVKSQTALRLGLDNALPDDLVANAHHVAAAILEPVRAHYLEAIVPSSWYRSEALERAICWGGNDETSSFARWCQRHERPVNDVSWYSYFKRKSHPSGEAVDFEVPGVPNGELARWIRDNLAGRFDQLILEFHKPGVPDSGWVHCSARVEGNRGQVLSIE